MTAPERLSLAEAAEALAAGRLSAEALAGACLERIEHGAAVNAWAFLDRAQALSEARAIDRAGRPGRLKGAPLGVKDVIDTTQLPTEHGSPIYRGNRPFADAACVALVRAEHGIVLGKTATTEFANRFPGPTVNPHNPAHTPGGSSSGSAAAVADFQVPVAFGTQTGGSVIRPAAFCGVIGYKPTFGEFSRVGIKMQSHSLDTLGIICRSLDDLALLRGVLLRGDVRPVDRAGGAPRLGLCRTPAWEAADAATQALIEETASRLSGKGASVREAEFAPQFSNILEVHRDVFYFEAARNYAYEYDFHHEQLSPVLRDTVLAPGRAIPLARYVEALEEADDFRAHLDDLFGEFDALLTPSAVGEAPAGLGSTGDARFNGLWTLGQAPCVTLPAGTGPGGLPLGIQLVGRRGRDEKLFAAAAWAEAHLS